MSVVQGNKIYLSKMDQIALSGTVRNFVAMTNDDNSLSIGFSPFFKGWDELEGWGLRGPKSRYLQCLPGKTEWYDY